jgi:hypothetical protein
VITVTILQIPKLNVIFLQLINHRSQGSLVSIVPGYELDDQAIEVRSPAEAKGFFL